VNTTSVIAERCAECGREEVRYYTQQLRSADEGSTVLYECDCGHKYVLFNLAEDLRRTNGTSRWNTNN